jgi:putative aldouronate transport system permease protein
MHPDILRGFFISLARSTLGPAFMVIVTSMAAYALARDDLVGRKFLNKYFIFTMYFSGGMIPLYLVMKGLNLTGSFWVYIIPGMFGAFNFVLVRTYIENIPSSLEEAALIDGASYITAFFRVVLPVCIPVLAAIVLFSCVGHWNAFTDTRLYNSMHRELFTMQYVLYNYLASTQTYSVEQALALGSMTELSPESIRMAITIITIVPVMCVYPALQKHFASGLLIGAVKG